MQTKLTSRDLMNREILGNDGSRIGDVKQVYLNDQSGVPEWVTVQTGWFGHRESFIPLAGATEAHGSLRVPYDKDTIKNAPRIDTDEHLDQKDVVALNQHYGLATGALGTQRQGMRGRPDPGYANISEQGRMGTQPMTGKAGSERVAGANLTGKAGSERVAGADLTGKAGTERVAGADRPEAEVTRSEERMRIGTEERETGRVRLRKWVETEHVSKAVPVVHEEIRIEHEPILEGEAGNAVIGEQEEEIVLHEEHAVSGKETVPVERVRLAKERVTEEQMVEDDLRREHVEIVDDTEPRADRPEGRTRE